MHEEFRREVLSPTVSENSERQSDAFLLTAVHNGDSTVSRICLEKSISELLCQCLPLSEEHILTRVSLSLHQTQRPHTLPSILVVKRTTCFQAFLQSVKVDDDQQ